MQYAKYFGIPYAYRGEDRSGVDCIGLCKMIAKDKGINIGDINYDNIALDDVYNVFNVNISNKNKYLLVEPQQDSLVVFRIMGKIQHVGYMIDNVNFLHIMKNSNVTMESIRSVVWNKRLVGCYKYVG